MIEAQIISWLQPKLNIPCHHAVPKNATYPLITIERVGGTVKNMLDYPSLAIQIWADTPAKACTITYKIRNLFLTEQLPNGVFNARIENFYEFPDPDTRVSRYQLLVNLTTQL